MSAWETNKVRSMNCEEFLGLATDLARGGDFPHDAAVHYSECQSCAARFSEQRELTDLLSSLARAHESLEAPMKVEAQLVSAFREQSRKQSTVPWPAVAASVIVVVLAISVYRNRTETVHTQTPKTPAVAVKPSGSGASPCCVVEFRELPAKPPANARQRRKRAATAKFVTAKRNNSGEREREITTEFFPLPYGNPLEPITSAQIVRIRLPRSAMKAVGLPVNENRIAGEVDADVMIGDDMAVRAIRFVK